MRGSITLVLGGARSGKSAWAEEVAVGSGRRVLYVATATAGDDEMADRIATHQAQRPAGWSTVEAPFDLAATVRSVAERGDAVLVDCLTLWVSNVVLEEIGRERDADALESNEWAAIEERLLAAVNALATDARARGLTLILVSNEVGMGLVPLFPLGRHYRDMLGRVNQAAATTADSVVLMIAGLPVDLRRLIYASGLGDGDEPLGGKGREVARDRTDCS